MSGYRIHHETKRNRKTGARVQIIDNRDGSFEADCVPGEGAWVTFCDTHGNYCLHDTLHLASLHYSHPEGWCDGCEEAYDG